jgi:hypothetical protein
MARGRFFVTVKKLPSRRPTLIRESRGYGTLLREKLPHSRVGFTAIQTRPASRALGGAGRGCDSCGVFDLRDLGSKPAAGLEALST